MRAPVAAISGRAFVFNNGRRRTALEQMNFRPGRVVAVLAFLLAAGGYYYWQHRDADALPPGFARGNGRIEAVEIDIATKTPGRIREILVNEGDFVTAGQVLARMDTEQLQAQRRQAEAQLQRATINVETAKSLVNQREAERRAAEAVVDQRIAQLDTTSRKLDRSEQLIKSNAVSQQVLDDDRSANATAKAALAAAQAQVAASEAAISSSRAMGSMPARRSMRQRPRSKASTPTSTTAC